MVRNLELSHQGQEQGKDVLSHHLLFNIILEVTDNSIRQQKEVKGIQTEEKEVKLSLFADDHLCKNLKKLNKILELIAIIAGMKDTRLIYRTQSFFFFFCITATTSEI